MESPQKDPGQEKPEGLKIGSPFTFDCHKGIACFNTCCSDVTILLTPYDVVRMRTGLGMGSSAFLKKHTSIIRHESSPFPLVMLKCPTTKTSNATL